MFNFILVQEYNITFLRVVSVSAAMRTVDFCLHVYTLKFNTFGTASKEVNVRFEKYVYLSDKHFCFLDGGGAGTLFSDGKLHIAHILS